MTFRSSLFFTRRGTWRRALLLGAGTAALVLGGSLSAQAADQANPYAPYPAMTTMYEGAMEMQVLPPSGAAPTWQEVSRVVTELNAAKAATAKYQDVRVAEAAGYYTYPVLRVAEQGYHYINRDYTREWALGRHDFSHPPVLVYNQVHGQMVLSGLMYLVPWNTTPKQLATIFPPSMAGWHRHINNCIKGSDRNGTLIPYHTQSACTAHGGIFGARAFGWMTHAWIWHDTAGTSLFAMDMASDAPMTSMPGM